MCSERLAMSGIVCILVGESLRKKMYDSELHRRVFQKDTSMPGESEKTCIFCAHSCKGTSQRKGNQGK